MYAIIDVAGQQFKVEKGQKIYVHRLDNEEGSDINIDEVLLIDNEGKITIGEPLINGAFVEGKVLSHIKGDKVIVFKKKRRKGYKVRNGHRQQFSQLEILTINEKGAPRKSAEKAKPAEVKAETKAAPKAAAEAKKTTAASKPAAKAAPKASTTVKAKAEKETSVETKEKKPAAKKTAAAKKPAAKKTAAAKKPAAKKTTAASKPAAKKTAAKPKATPKKDKPAGDAKK